MNVFQRLFSVNPGSIKKDVILTPFLNTNYFRQSAGSPSIKGFLFQVLEEKDFSVIRTGIGPSFVADAALYLRQTPCERVYFIGSCGSVSGLLLGDILAVESAFAYESFTHSVKKLPAGKVSADKRLLDDFLKTNKGQCKKAKVATVCSLSLEEEKVFPFKAKNARAVDLETSVFYSAAKYCGFSALAVLYVSDIVKRKPFYRNISPSESGLIKESRAKAVSLLCRYIKERNA